MHFQKFLLYNQALLNKKYARKSFCHGCEVHMEKSVSALKPTDLYRALDKREYLVIIRENFC